MNQTLVQNYQAQSVSNPQQDPVKLQKKQLLDLEISKTKLQKEHEMLRQQVELQNFYKDAQNQSEKQKIQN